MMQHLTDYTSMEHATDPLRYQLEYVIGGKNTDQGKSESGGIPSSGSQGSCQYDVSFIRIRPDRQRIHETGTLSSVLP